MGVGGGEGWELPFLDPRGIVARRIKESNQVFQCESHFLSLGLSRSLLPSCPFGSLGGRRHDGCSKAARGAITHIH